MKGASWPEMTVAISAVVIGLAALFVSTYEVRLLREDQRISVGVHQPDLEFKS